MFPGDRRRGGMNNRGRFPGFPEILGFLELPGFPTMGMGGSPFGSIFGGRDPFFQNPMPMPMPGFGHHLISPFDDSDGNEEENYAHPDASFIHQRAFNPPLPQQELMPLFSDFGQVSSIVFDNKRKDTAVIRFNSIVSEGEGFLEQVKEKLQNTQFGERTLLIEPFQSESLLFIGNLTPDIDDNALIQMFEKHGHIERAFDTLDIVHNSGINLRKFRHKSRHQGVLAISDAAIIALCRMAPMLEELQLVDKLGANQFRVIHLDDSVIKENASNLHWLKLLLPEAIKDMSIVSSLHAKKFFEEETILVLTKSGQIYYFRSKDIEKELRDAKILTTQSQLKPNVLKLAFADFSISVAKLVNTHLPKIRSLCITGHHNGTTNIWDVSSAQLLLLSTIEPRNDVEATVKGCTITAIEFCSSSGYLIVVDQLGMVQIFKVLSEKDNAKHQSSSHSQGSFGQWDSLF